MRTLDSGTMGGDAGWGFRWVMLGVTLGGIFVVSALIGVLSSGLEGKLDELRKGRSVVIEKDHTIILNWSASISLASASKRRPRATTSCKRPDGLHQGSGGPAKAGHYTATSSDRSSRRLR
jgi:hypothetical protein